MSVVHHTIRGFTLLLLFGASAHAAIISNTLDGNSGDTAKSLTSKPAAGSFIADATGNLGNLELDLAKQNATGAILITLNANKSGVPGSVLNTIATVVASTIPSSETLYDFRNLSISGLTPGSTYWIEAAKSGTSTGAEAFTTTTRPTAGSGQIYWSGSGASANSTSTSQFLADCVSSGDGCDASFPASASFTFNEGVAAPEPASVAILGAGLGGLGWIRRRKTGAAKVSSI